MGVIRDAAETTFVKQNPMTLSEHELCLDDERNNAYMLMRTAYSVHNHDGSINGRIAFPMAHFTHILGHTDVQDVLVSVSPAEQQYFVTVDVARPDIQATDVAPLLEHKPLPPVEEMQDSAIRKLWTDARANTSTDAQCSLVLTVISHFCWRYHGLLQTGITSNIDTFPKTTVQRIPGSKKVYVMAHYTINAPRGYAFGRELFESLKGISETYIDNVEVIIEPSEQSHKVYIRVCVSAVPDSARGWRPYYPAPFSTKPKEKRVSVRERDRHEEKKTPEQRAKEAKRRARKKRKKHQRKLREQALKELLAKKKAYNSDTDGSSSSASSGTVMAAVPAPMRFASARPRSASEH